MKKTALFCLFLCLCCLLAGCGHTHAFTEEVAFAPYIKTRPTCMQEGVFYKSCLCGEAGEETFTYTPLQGLHDFGGGTSNGDGYHTETCSYNAEHTRIVLCNGGTATCSAPAVCTTCGAAYGDVAPCEYKEGICQNCGLPVPPEGYQWFNNGDICFLYPASWSRENGPVTMLMNEMGVGDNITVTREVYSDIYDTMTGWDFREFYHHVLDAMGASPLWYGAKHLENKNGQMIHYFSCEIVLGKTMVQNLFVLPAGEYNYIVTLTETVWPDYNEPLRTAVIDSLLVLN